MFKLIGTTRDKIDDVLAKTHDPLILDVRTPKKDRELAKRYDRDYRVVEELTNKGLTRIIFKARTAGVMQLRKVTQRCVEYQRELVILHDNESHFKELKRLVNECVRELHSVQSGEHQ